MPKKTRVEHQPLVVPQNLEEAARFLLVIGQEQREIDRIQAALNERVEKLKDQAITNARSHKERIRELLKGLFVFAENNRDTLTDGGKRKTVELTTGWFGWRKTPPAVSIRDTESVLARLKKLGLKRFIRTKEAPDKEAMLKEPETVKMIKGVSIGQREDFVAKPVEIEMEIVLGADKLKREALL